MNTKPHTAHSPATGRAVFFRRLITLLVIPLCAASAAAFPSAYDPALAPGANLRIMSFNILSEEWNDQTPVDGRKDTVAQTILQFAPDVVGLQEVSDNWYAVLPALISADYTMVCPQNALGQTNYTGMAFNKKKVKLLDSGTHIFAAGNSTKMRLVTWGHYERLDNLQRFVVMNTHWDISQTHRISEAQEMAAIFLAKKQQFNCPIISVGDFNSNQSSTEYIYYATETGMKNARVDAEIVNSDHRTSHVLGLKPRAGRLHESIDQIFYTDDLACYLYNNLMDQPILDASDHCPIYADFAIGLNDVRSTVVLAPDADAVCRGGTTNTNENFGTEPILEARDADSSSLDRRSFVRFDLAQVPAGRGIAKATLWLWVTESENPVNAVHFVSHDAWIESGGSNSIRWGNMPQHTTPALHSKTVPNAGNWVAFDVTAAAKTEFFGDGLLSLAIVSNRTAKAVYSSREGSHPPHLVVETDGNSPAILAHWRFEQGRFRADSSGNGRDLSRASTEPALLLRPTTGAGSAFGPLVPQIGIVNNGSANFGTAQAGHFSVADTGWMDVVSLKKSLTVEAYANIQATHTVATDIVSQWRASTGERSFRLGVNPSRNLFLSISSDGNAAQTTTSSITLSLNTDYYLAASFDANNAASGVKIYIKNLTTNGPLHIETFPSPATTINNSPALVNVGTFNSGASARWKGLIDEVRISDRALPLRSLLISRPKPDVLAHWRFESDNYRGDASGHNRTLSSASTEPVLRPRPASGAGSKFSHPIPQSGAANGSSANFGTAQAGHFTVANTGWMDRVTTAKAFTVEAYANVQAPHASNTYLASHWRASAGERSFMFGINPANTVVLVVSPDGLSTQSIASNFTLSLNTDYYVAASFDANNPTSGVKFYVRNLTNNGALQVQTLATPYTTLSNSPAAVNVGTFNNAAAPRWKGLIDEVRISAEALPQSELLISMP